MFNLIKEFSSDLKKEFNSYSFNLLQKDLLAGLTVAAVALPLALAFGVSSGADASSGLITAIFSAFLIGALSGASFQISGPTGAMSAILLPLSAKYGIEGVLIAGLLAGIFLVLAGLLKLGKLVSFLPSPVIAGFTSGIAVIIALGQIDNFFGVKSHGENAIARIIYLFQNGFHPNFFTVLIGSVSIAIMLFWPKKLNAKIPASLICIILATIVNSIFKLPVPVVGDIPKTLIHANRIPFSPELFKNLDNFLLPAISIGALCMIESLLCGVVAGRMKGEKLRGNRELIAQGIGNIILPFLGGVPATSAIARTSVAIKSGQVTRLTGIIHGLFLMVFMFLFSSVMSKIPLASLSGILIITAWRMNEFENIDYIFSKRFKGAEAKFLITMIVTITFDLTIAIACGLIFSIIYFVFKISNLDVSVSEIDPKRLGQTVNISKKTKVVYVTGPVFFGSLDVLSSVIEQLDDDNIIFSMRGVPFIDTSGLQTLLEFCIHKQSENKKVLFSSLQPAVKKSIDKAGISELISEDLFFNTAKEAIEFLEI